ncbi:MAG: DNA methylase N-4/N-6 [Pseudomonadota bacterium]
MSTFLNQLSPDLPSSTNQGTGDVAFQRWFRVKEAFSPLFVRDVVNSLPAPPRSCLDCFGGSGTTAITCQFLNVAPTTIELNPFLADLIEAKLTSYDAKLVAADRDRIASTVATMPIDLAHDYAEAPPTLFEPGAKERWIFDLAVMGRLAQYRCAIALLEDPSHRRLFTVLLGSTLVHLSNVVINGKGRRYRGGWERNRRTAADVDLAFQRAFDNALYDICRLPGRAHRDFQLLRGDARLRMAELKAPFDLILFSPPYPNSFDYTDIYNIELWVLGYLTSGADNLRLRRSTLRSHVQIKRDSNVPEQPSETLAPILKGLAAKSADLWSPQIPGMVGSYFADLERILFEARRLISADGRVAMVVGDSRYADIVVPVARILAEIGNGLGFEVDRLTVLRPMRASAQQGGDHLLSEDLLVLKPRASQ